MTLARSLNQEYIFCVQGAFSGRTTINGWGRKLIDQTRYSL